ncbi:MAG: right-handed parallel beta-helix repeat-containing protein, partial [Litorimonas sp.]
DLSEQALSDQLVALSASLTRPFATKALADAALAGGDLPDGSAAYVLNDEAVHGGPTFYTVANGAFSDPVRAYEAAREGGLVFRLEDYGLPVTPSGDGSFDAGTALNRVLDLIETIGGGTVLFRSGRTYSLGRFFIPDGCTLAGESPDIDQFPTIKVVDDLPENAAWVAMRSSGGLPTQVARDITIRNLRFDSSARPYHDWLSQADGTPIADPEADYVMGTGALASGISGVDLTAVVADGAVTGVTINNGGTGWNGHPNHPYQPDQVELLFEGGGGRGAIATANIVGGTLGSVTIVNGGEGYTSAPTVTAQGGYADIALLATPEVDRRNASYNDTGAGIALTRVLRPRMENCVLTGFRGIAVSVGGCKDGVFERIHAEDCGKEDGPFHVFWVGHAGGNNPAISNYAPSEWITLRGCTTENLRRSFALFRPQGGLIEDCIINGAGESAILPGTHDWFPDRPIIIRNNRIGPTRVTDIASSALEAYQLDHGEIYGNTIVGSARTAIAGSGSRHLRIHDNTMVDCASSVSTNGSRNPYGPFAERFGFGQGTSPIAGRDLRTRGDAYVSTGNLSEASLDVEIANNTFIERRASGYPKALIKARRVGPATLKSRDVRIVGNSVVDTPIATGGDMVLHAEETTGVYDDEMTLVIRGNHGHVSEGAVHRKISIAQGALGQLSVTGFGFPPKRLEVRANVPGATTLQSFIGTTVWSRNQSAPVSQSSGLALSDADGNPEFASRENEFVQLYNGPGPDGAVGRVNFAVWTVDGFVLQVVDADVAMDLLVVAYP